MITYAVVGIIIIAIIAIIAKKLKNRPRRDRIYAPPSPPPSPGDPYAKVKKYWNDLRVDQREEICSKIGLNLKNAQKEFDKIRKKDLMVNEIGKRISKEKDRKLVLRERAKLDAERRAEYAEERAGDAEERIGTAEERIGTAERRAEYAEERAKEETEDAKKRAKKAEDDVRFWKEEAGKASSSKRDQNTPPYRGQSGKWLRIEVFLKKCEKENPNKSKKNLVFFDEIIGVVEEKEEVKEVKDRLHEGGIVSNCNAKLRDETGVINITIWDPDFESIQNGSEVTIKEGYAGIWDDKYNIQCGGKFGGKISPVSIEQEKVKDILGSKKLDVLDYRKHPLYRPETENSSKKGRYTDENLDDLVEDFIRAGYHKEKFKGEFENELWLLELIILTELLLRSKESSKFEQTQEQQQQQKEEERKYEEEKQDKEKIHYEIFGVSKDATQAEIKAAYRKLAKKWHPDKHQDDKNFQDEMMKKINEANEILSDPVKRRKYDDSL